MKRKLYTFYMVERVGPHSTYSTQSLFLTILRVHFWCNSDYMKRLRLIQVRCMQGTVFLSIPERVII